MKKVWVKAIPWNKSVVTTALENGAEAVMVAPEDTGKLAVKPPWPMGASAETLVKMVHAPCLN